MFPWDLSWQNKTYNFRRSIRLKQMDRTCWTIQTHSDELKLARRWTLPELNSLSLVRLMKSSTFDLGQSAIYGNGRQYINGPQNKKN